MIRSWLLTLFYFVLASQVSAEENSVQSFLDKAEAFALWNLEKVPSDPSNRLFNEQTAIELGAKLFTDANLSRSGDTSCASCHMTGGKMIPNESRPALRDRKNRTVMSILGSGYQSFLFWDGRADSLWSQALEPLENPSEHNFTRTEVVSYVQEAYASEMKILGIPAVTEAKSILASPLGNRQQRAAWDALPNKARTDINHSFASIGKVIAAYEANLPVPYTDWEALLTSLKEKKRAPIANLEAIMKGFELFSGKARCASCHNGPLFSDGDFHNNGMPSLENTSPDLGKQSAVLRLLSNEFNCLGPYSDAVPEKCYDMLYQNRSIERSFGAFRTPSLRGVSKRERLGHAGQISSLEEMVRHYNVAPIGPYVALIGQEGASELVPLRLSDKEIFELIAFLETL